MTHPGDPGSPFLSDRTAVADYPLARRVTDALDIRAHDKLDQMLPAGNLSIFAALGLEEMELGAVSAEPWSSPLSRARCALERWR